MKVSVVIPLYNKAAYIRRAVDSVLAQTYQDFELIVVDDGSTDNGTEIVAAYKDPRVRLIRQANAGVSAARNRGVAEAQAELVAFLDADDEWRPWFLETVISLRQRFPEAGAFATAYELHDGKLPWRPNFNTGVDVSDGGLMPNYFLAACYAPPICSSSTMVRREVFAPVGGFPVGTPLGEDQYLWAALALNHPIAWSPVSGAIYHCAAQGRVCDTIPLPPDTPLAGLLENLPDTEKHYYAREYLNFVRLNIARDHLVRGPRKWARDLLRKTRHTSLWKKRRLILLGLSFIPAPFLRWGMALRRLICQ